MTMPSEKPLGLNHRSYENRRASKPLMEKRRRARINQSLADLKSLIIDTVKKETQRQNTRHTKLEKADILEMTVLHLRNLHLQRTTTETETTFKAGFNECVKEVSHFLDHFEGLDASLKSRLISHLSLMSQDSGITTGDESSSSSSSGSRCATPASAILESPSCSPMGSRQEQTPSLSPRPLAPWEMATSSQPCSPVQILANGQRLHPAFILSEGSLYCYTNSPLDLASCSSRSRQNVASSRCQVGDHNGNLSNLQAIDDSVWRPW